MARTCNAILNKTKDLSLCPTELTPFPATYRENGMDCELVDRKDDVAIVRQTRTDAPGREWFEVFRIVQSKPYAIQQKNGKRKGLWYHYGPKETSPGNNLWGVIGWTFGNIESAKKKFAEIA